MKKVVLTGLRQMACIDGPEPVLSRDTDVLLDVAVVGVCGSDVHYYTTGRIGSQVVAYPFAVGHEFSATVRAVGAAVTRVKPGDRVAVDPATACGTCDQCRAGRPHTCRALTFLGCPGQAEGCLCERVVMHEQCCFPIADTVTLEQAALVEPFSIGVYAVALSRAAPGSAIGILGCGPIGLSVLAAARAEGIERVFVTDPIDARLAVASRAGAQWTGNPDRDAVVPALAREEPARLDCVFECCGRQEALDQAVELLKPGGTLMLIGIPEVDRVSFGIDLLRRKELCIQNVRRQNDCVQPALDRVADGQVALDFMVTHHFSLDESRAAFDLVADYRDGVVKALIHVGS